MNDPHLEQYLALCERVFERMLRDGTWPWKEKSPPPIRTGDDSLLDSESHHTDV